MSSKRSKSRSGKCDSESEPGKPDPGIFSPVSSPTRNPQSRPSGIGEFHRFLFRKLRNGMSPQIGLEDVMARAVANTTVACYFVRTTRHHHAGTSACLHSKGETYPERQPPKCRQRRPGYFSPPGTKFRNTPEFRNTTKAEHGDTPCSAFVGILRKPENDLIEKAFPSFRSQTNTVLPSGPFPDENPIPFASPAGRPMLIPAARSVRGWP